ncbi:CLUMA_CG018828, isoform A [Clunio marinus]|uniref:Cyclin-dependent kinase 20 n=1 Tax=Clunio marinus TaxID=568069 RepID=A0A1J1J0D9_9DIPT|nr:CLUMA_CG018828, isoform A [Clunio marinus]
MNEYIPNRYKILQKIGEGVHGVVLKAIDTTENNKVVAIKMVSLRTKFGGISPNTLREIKSLQHADNEYIISMLDMYPDLSGLALVFEYMPNTLYSKLKDEENPLSRQQIQSYTKMLLRGLSYLHDELKIMHRDIKPANLLINEHDVLKLADFGLARLYNPDEPRKCYSPQVATRWYRAPEILWGTQIYGPSIDMWSVGCVFAEMLRGVPLFSGNTDIEQLALVIRTLGTPSTADWPEVKNLPDYNKISFPNSKREEWVKIFPSFTTKEEIRLVDDLVKYNPKHRLTASEALCHEYFG